MLTASFIIFFSKKTLHKLTWYIFLILQTGKIRSSCLHALQGCLQQLFWFGPQLKRFLQDVNGFLCIACKVTPAASEIPDMRKRLCVCERVCVRVLTKVTVYLVSVQTELVRHEQMQSSDNEVLPR